MRWFSRGAMALALVLAACDGSGGGTDATGGEGVVPEALDPGPGLDAADDAQPDRGDPAGDVASEAAADPAPDPVADESTTQAEVDAAPDAAGDPAGEGGCREGAPCDDGDPCTTGETCHAGVCGGGTKLDCDDHRDCTTDTCDGKGGCAHAIAAGTCLIDGVCRKSGDLDGCNGCNPAKSATAWTVAADATSCDPKGVLGPCDVASTGKCLAGVCKPDDVLTRGCDDSNPCTRDLCDAATGCYQDPEDDGTACVLADPCKPGACRAAKCVVPADASCDDANPCTTDSCGANGCVHDSLDGAACDARSKCVVNAACVQGECQGIAANCDDGNLCTVDGCDATSGCWHDPVDNTCCHGGASICDDGKPCTSDDCDPVTLACVYTPNTAGCDDKDPCTVADTCSNESCAGTPKNCSDGNSCTLDTCSGGNCLHTPLDDGTPCDDGKACSTGDHCVAGTCVADETGCLCQPAVSPSVSKITTLTVATTGNPGDGLDLDNNASTCSPGQAFTPPDCSGGIQNALGVVAGIKAAQDGIAGALAKGQIMLLLEERNLKTDGTPFTIAVYIGRLDPANPDCDFQNATCLYQVDRKMLKPDCTPLVAFDNARIVGDHLTAGGKGYTFPFDLPISGINLHLDLYVATLDATVVVSSGKVTALNGMLGGAAPKQEIVDAVNAIPDGTLPPPATKDLILMLLNSVDVDIDGDGDGTKESSSIGLKLGAIGAQLTTAY